MENLFYETEELDNKILSTRDHYDLFKFNREWKLHKINTLIPDLLAKSKTSSIMIITLILNFNGSLIFNVKYL